MNHVLITNMPLLMVGYKRDSQVTQDTVGYINTLYKGWLDVLNHAAQ